MIVQDGKAVIELHSLATAQNGTRCDNGYGWSWRFAADNIVELRAYPDSAMFARWFKENPIPGSAGRV
jgi:ketosteroid isomerase-like protein